jgi:hypothetical protein
MKTALKFGLIALATTVSLPAIAFTHEGMTPAVLAYGMAAVYAEDCGSFTPEVAAAADAAMEKLKTNYGVAGYYTDRPSWIINLRVGEAIQEIRTSIAVRGLTSDQFCEQFPITWKKNDETLKGNTLPWPHPEGFKERA